MKSKLFWAVTACALICSLPAAAFAACTGPNPSTSGKTYTCICNNWKLTAESSLFYGCDGKPYVNTEIWGYDTKTCASTDYLRTTYQSVEKEVDDDCSSYTEAKTVCCIASEGWYYKPTPAVGDQETWDWGTQCEEKLCPKGQLQSLTPKQHGKKPW